MGKEKSVLHKILWIIIKLSPIFDCNQGSKDICKTKHLLLMHMG